MLFRSAPVISFCRIDDRPIRTREPVTHPDALIIGDPTLLHQVSVFDGAGNGTLVLINTSRDARNLGIGQFTRTLHPPGAVTVPATELAVEHLGRPVPNAALLGAFAALTGQVSLGAVCDAIRDRFPDEVGAGNARAAEVAHDHVRASMRRLTDA